MSAKRSVPMPTQREIPRPVKEKARQYGILTIDEFVEEGKVFHRMVVPQTMRLVKATIMARDHDDDLTIRILVREDGLETAMTYTFETGPKSYNLGFVLPEGAVVEFESGYEGSFVGSFFYEIA